MNENVDPQAVVNLILLSNSVMADGTAAMDRLQGLDKTAAEGAVDIAGLLHEFDARHTKEAYQEALKDPSQYPVVLRNVLKSANARLKTASESAGVPAVGRSVAPDSVSPQNGTEKKASKNGWEPNQPRRQPPGFEAFERAMGMLQ